jgi:hypothetical protein
MEQLTLSRKELYDLVWEEPMLSLSRKFKISDTGLRKICMRLKIPLPKSGHWQKLKFGKKVKKTPLPDVNDPHPQTTLELRNEEGLYTIPEPSPVKSLQKEIEAFLGQQPGASGKPGNQDKLVAELRKILQSQKPDKREYINAVRTRRESLDTRVAKELILRATQFWESLITALKLRGHAISLRNWETNATVEEHYFRVLLREKVKMEVIKEGNWDRRIFHPTGILSFQVKSYPAKEWKDGRQSIEQQIPAILAWLEIQGNEKKADRLEHARKEMERKERERIQAAFEKRRAEEVAAFKTLLQKAARWHKANNLRNYIAEVTAKHLPGENQENCIMEWLEWAKAKIDWYDPFVEKPDDLLDAIDRETLAIPKPMHSYF